VQNMLYNRKLGYDSFIKEWAKPWLPIKEIYKEVQYQNVASIYGKVSKKNFFVDFVVLMLSNYEWKVEKITGVWKCKTNATTKAHNVFNPVCAMQYITMIYRVTSLDSIL